jgi:SNF2 family DNA or RNA helicase
MGRLGKDGAVMVRRFVCRGSVERFIGDRQGVANDETLVPANVDGLSRRRSADPDQSELRSGR